MRMLLTSFLILAFALNSQIAFAKIDNDFVNLAKVALDAFEEQQKQKLTQSLETRIDVALSEHDSAEVFKLLEQNPSYTEFRDIYSKTSEIFSMENSENKKTAVTWLEKCAQSASYYRAHKCSISLAILSVQNMDTSALLDWATKASEISSTLREDDERYWYMQKQSFDFMTIAFIYERNIDEAIHFGGKYVEAGLKSKDRVQSFYLINNIAYLARVEIGVELAIKILEVANENIELLDDENKEILFYSLGRNHLAAGDYKTAYKYYSEFLKYESRDDLSNAAKGNLALIYSQLGKFDLAKKYADEAEVAYQGNLESEIGLNILTARKNIAVAEQSFAIALRIDEELDRVDDILEERAISSHRARLSKNLQIAGERQKRETDKLQYEAQLSAQRAKASRTQLFLSLCALVFLVGLVTYVFRSFRKEKRLNAEIQEFNNELERKNKELYIAHANVTNTFEQLQIAHRRAMAGQEAKQKFIGVVGHELRTPLNPIINLSEVLEARETDPKDKALLKAIKNAGKRLHIIVENMLAISSADKDSRVFIEMVDVVYEATTVVEEFVPDIKERNEKTISEGKYININVYKHPDLKSQCVSNKIIYRSIVRNLFDNAVKFTAHGEISVHLQLRKGGPGFQLEIRDTGQGMDTEKISEFMRPFEQAEMGLGRSHEGAGLGLAVVHKYCEQLGAKMQINSTVGKGTRITIDFPEPAHEEDTGKLLKVA